MDWSDIIQSGVTTLVGGTVTALVLGWLFREARPTARKEGPLEWLEYPWAMKGFALFFGGIVCALIVTWFLVDEKSKLPVLLLIGLFGIIACPFLAECFFVRIGFDDAYIYCYSPWRLSRTIRWDAITNCRYSPVNQWWILDTAYDGKVRISGFLAGRRTFFDALLRKTGIKAPVA